MAHRAGPDLPARPFATAVGTGWRPYPRWLLAFLLRFLLEWTLAQAAFWTTRVSAINQSYFVLILFLSGQMAPLEPVPALRFQMIANILPFRWMLGFPVELHPGPADADRGADRSRGAGALDRRWPSC